MKNQRKLRKNEEKANAIRLKKMKRKSLLIEACRFPCCVGSVTRAYGSEADLGTS